MLIWGLLKFGPSVPTPQANGGVAVGFPRHNRNKFDGVKPPLRAGH